jgi:hypothetical protein
MPSFADARARLTDDLAAKLRDAGETRARRREQWATAIQQAAFSGANITTQRTLADTAVTHLDTQLDILNGEIEALRVEVAQIDFEARHV